MSSLQTLLQQPNPNIKQWATKKRIYLPSIDDYVTNGALNAKGQLRLARARARQEKMRQRNSERVKLQKVSPQEYQRLHHEGLALLKNGQRPAAVANALKISPRVAGLWRTALTKRGDRAAVPPIEAGEQNSEKLRPLTSEDMTALAAALMFDPQLNVADWASEEKIIPDHAIDCVTNGALNEYGEKMLNYPFRRLLGQDMSSLQTLLQQPNPNIKQWATKKRIYLPSIDDYVTNGALNAKGQLRLARARARQEKMRQRNSERVKLKKVSRQEYQRLHHEGVALLNEGQRPAAVANALNISPQVAGQWRIALAKQGDRAAVPPIEAGEQNSESLRPLKSEDMTALAAAVMFDPQLNVAAWASDNGIIPDHATACITDGALNEYGQTMLKYPFRRLSGQDMSSLQALLQQPNPNIKQWAIKKRIYLSSIDDYVTNGALNAKGQTRLEQARARQEKMRQRNSERVKLKKESRQEYQRLRHEGVALPNKGQRPNKVANAPKLSHQVLGQGRIALAKRIPFHTTHNA